MAETVTLAWEQELMRGSPALKAELRRHARQQHISLSQHLNWRRLQLAKRINSKFRIYLDQRYWVFCRDAFDGRPSNPIHKEIADLLIELANSGRIVCPVSAAILQETAKIGDPSRRESTARLIDLLCKGIAIRSTSERMRMEFLRLLESRTRTSTGSAPLSNRVWTFPGWMLGDSFPTKVKFDPQIQLPSEKFLYDRFASMSFLEVLNFVTENKVSSYPRLDEMARGFNTGLKLGNDRKKKYVKLLSEEIQAVLNNGILFKNGVLSDPDEPNGSLPINATSYGMTSREVQGLITEILNDGLGESLKTELPTLYAWAAIHAMSRRKAEEYEANDLWDCDHACAALPYYNAFFTESHGATLLRQEPLAFDKTFNCRVLSKESDVLSFLNTL